MDVQTLSKNTGSKTLGAIGSLIGAVIGIYSGINLLIPLFASLGIWTIGSKFLSNDRKQMLLVLAVNGGHFLWLSIALILLGASALATLGGDLLFYAIGLLWIFIKPSVAPLYFLGIYQALSLIINGYSFVEADLGSPSHKALLVHLIWRSFAMFAIVKLYISMRKKRKEIDVPVSP